MDRKIVEEMVRALWPVLKDPLIAKEKLERFWLRKIAIIWTTEHVHRGCEVALTEDEARHVLQ
jgi:hypothetical protein